MNIKDWICLKGNHSHTQKMKETEKTLNSINLSTKLVKEILSRLPVKSLVKFKAVSKEWRSIAQSKSFIEMHLMRLFSSKNRD